jgi:hypothetical protein
VDSTLLWAPLHVHTVDRRTQPGWAGAHCSRERDHAGVTLPAQLGSWPAGVELADLDTHFIEFIAVVIPTTVSYLQGRTVVLQGHGAKDPLRPRAEGSLMPGTTVISLICQRSPALVDGPFGFFAMMPECQNARLFAKQQVNHIKSGVLPSRNSCTHRYDDDVGSQCVGMHGRKAHHDTDNHRRSSTGHLQVSKGAYISKAFSGCSSNAKSMSVARAKLLAQQHPLSADRGLQIVTCSTRNDKRWVLISSRSSSIPAI